MTECKATECDADVAETAVKRKIVKADGTCETCPDKKKTDPEDNKKCADVVCEKAGWGPSKLAVCVDLQTNRIDDLPDGVEDTDIIDAQKTLNTILEEVDVSLKALGAKMKATIKVAFGIA